MKKPIQFGKYYLLDRINVGGMAEVFRAKAYGVEGFERLLAVKRILPNIAEDKEFISMFIDEAKIAVQLQHANICQIFDLGKVEESYFIALEFVAGKDLRALFDRCKQRPEGGSVTMPVAQACFVTMKMCEGLDYAHNKKDQSGKDLHLVHRDVSPQNIIVSYDGEVKLIDFGIAKSVGKASKTQAGILKGKFGYMSPEQVRGLPLDRRSDVFSVGIVLYELLTGERLFTGETDFSTLEKVRNVEILPPSTYNRKIPDELERIVLKALAKDVEDRYQNAIDLHDDLQAFMYTAGEFYSRKDLAAWMKKTFAKEMAEEAQRLDQYPQMPPLPSVPASRPSAGRPAVPPPPPALEVVTSAPPPPLRSGGNGRAAAAVAVAAPKAQPQAMADSELSWDDEELETHVYDQPKDASDAVVAEVDDISGLHEVASFDADSGPNGRSALDDIDLSPDGAPVPAKKQPTPATGVPTVNIKPAQAQAAMQAALAQATAAAGPGPNGAGVAHAPPPVIAPVPQAPSLFDELPATNISRPAPRSQATAISRAPARPSFVAQRWPLVAAAGGLIVLLLGGALLLVLMNRSGTVQITTDPPDGVRILVDNRPVHLDELGRVKLDPGSYALQVEREGYVQWRDRVDVKAGETLKRRVELEPLARAGFTLLSDPAGASASLDGKDLGGRTPFKVEGLLPGKHLLEVVGTNGRVWSEQIVLEPGKMAEIHASLNPVAVAPRKEIEPPLDPPRPVVRELPTREPPPPVRPPHTPVRPVAHVDREPPPPVREQPKKTPKLPAAPPPDEEPRTPPPPKKEVASSGGEGYLRLGSKPATKVIIDGKDTGQWTPIPKLSLSAGTHKVTLTNPQLQIKETFTVEIKPGESETVIKDLRSQTSDGE